MAVKILQGWTLGLPGSMRILTTRADGAPVQDIVYANTECTVYVVPCVFTLEAPEASYIGLRIRISK
ncbi:hypothetical protein N7488_005459 [Penicillium malachiteum]|nr:hypothetical protein N7488_005459 [Penicillium malachiteum]